MKVKKAKKMLRDIAYSAIRASDSLEDMKPRDAQDHISDIVTSVHTLWDARAALIQECGDMLDLIEAVKGDHNNPWEIHQLPGFETVVAELEVAWRNAKDMPPLKAYNYMRGLLADFQNFGALDIASRAELSRRMAGHFGTYWERAGDSGDKTNDPGSSKNSQNGTGEGA